MDMIGLHILVFVLSMPNTGIGMGMSVVIMLHIVSCVAQSPARSVIFSHVLPSIPHRHGLNQSRIMKRRWRLRKMNDVANRDSSLLGSQLPYVVFGWEIQYVQLDAYMS